MNALRDKRALFTRLLPRLIDKMIAEGRTPLLGKDGLKHKPGSLNYEGLAGDIDLFKGDEYLDKTEDHQIFGEFWEGLHPDCYWGGNGPKQDDLKNDGNHYCVTYLGKK